MGREAKEFRYRLRCQALPNYHALRTAKFVVVQSNIFPYSL